MEQNGGLDIPVAFSVVGVTDPLAIEPLPVITENARPIATAAQIKQAMIIFWSVFITILIIIS